jgi:hypothetical protein
MSNFENKLENLRDIIFEEEDFSKAKVGNKGLARGLSVYL